MSSTVRFTPLHPVDHDTVYTSRNSHGAGVRIRDLPGLKTELSDTLVAQMDTRDYVDRDEYPGKEWMLLLGFSTWAGDDDMPGSDPEYHNVSNTDAEDMARLWGTVSEFTDPFVVYQTGFDGGWPHAAELVQGDGTMYRVEARDGDVELERLTVSITEIDPVEF